MARVPFDNYSAQSPSLSEVRYSGIHSDIDGVDVVTAEVAGNPVQIPSANPEIALLQHAVGRLEREHVALTNLFATRIAILERAVLGAADPQIEQLARMMGGVVQHPMSTHLSASLDALAHRLSDVERAAQVSPSAAVAEARSTLAQVTAKQTAFEAQVQEWLEAQTAHSLRLVDSFKRLREWIKGTPQGGRLRVLDLDEPVEGLTDDAP